MSAGGLTSTFFSLAREEWRAHPVRLAVGVLAIALGVALGYAVHLVNRAALTEFSAAIRNLNGDADLEVRGGRGGFDDGLLDRVAALPGVALAQPVLELDVAPLVEPRSAGPRTGLKLYGVDALAAADMAPALVGVPRGDAASLAVLDAALFLSPAALHALGLAPGATLRLGAGDRAIALPVAGDLPLARPGQLYGTLDIAAAQALFGQVGRITRIDIKLQPGAQPETVRAALQPLLPAGVGVATPAESATRTSNLSRAYRVNLNMLALVALFTGAFLVFSTQALAVVRRRSQLALLRVLGARRRDLRRQVQVEGALLGAVGGALGIALGDGTARLVLRWMGGDLGGGYFPGVAPQVSADPVGAMVVWALAVAAAWAGSLVPAREAAAAPPAQALKAGDEELPLARFVRPWVVVLFLGGGLALALAPPVRELPVGGYLSVALLLTGGLAAMPAFTARVFGGLARRPPRPLVVQLALARLAGAPGQASIALAGILASFSLMIAMAVMVGSFRSAVEDWLGKVLPADLYVRAAISGDTGHFSEADQRALRQAASRVSLARTTSIVLDARRPAVALIARPIDTATADQWLPLTGPARTQVQGRPAWVSEACADLYGLKPGARLVLPVGGRSEPFTVAGVWRDYARQFGAIVIRAEDYVALTGDARWSEAALWLPAGRSAAEAIRSIQSAVRDPARLEFAASGELRAISLAIFDRSFAVTYVLEVVAILIGLFGIAATFSAQVLARAREFGMLRHLGLRRRDVLALIGTEGLLVSVLGAGVGLAWGIGIGAILIYVVNPQSFHWTMPMRLPLAAIAPATVALILAGSLTAVWAARRATSGDVVRSVRDDW